MPSPDISPYYDVTLYDAAPEEIIAHAEEYARLVLPEFTRIPGSIEDAMMQAASSFTSDLKGSINRMTAGAVEVLLQLLGIERDSGTAATGSLTITVIDSLGHDIPVGTRFGYRDVSDPSKPVLYTFDTTTELSIPPGSTTGTVDILATLTREYPELLGGQVLQLLTPLSFVSTAVLATDLSQGADGEDDATYFARAIATLNSYSQAIVLPQQYDHFVLTNYTDVYRAKTYSRVNPAADTIAGWTAANGYVTIYVSKVGGASLTNTSRQAIEDDIADHATAGLNINVENAHLQSVPVAVSVTLKAGYNGADVIDAVETALNQYVQPDYWDWSSTIYRNELIALVDRVEGVDRVVTATINGLSADYSFTKFGTLPVGSLSVSVSS